MAAAATESSTSETPTLQQAFASAKEEHAGQPAGASRTEVSPGQTESKTQPDETTASSPAKPNADATGQDLISDEEYQALATTHANDPARLVKELKKVFTQKTQALADERKSLEPLKDLAEFREIIEAYQEDPDATIRALADAHGISLAEAKAVVAEAKTEGAKAEATGQPGDLDVTAVLKQHLGPEMDFLAEKLGPAVKAIAEQIVGQQVKPLADNQQTLLTQAAQEQAASVMKAFGADHPDWQQHEPAMVALSEKLPPGKGVTEAEYLDLLYRVVTRDTAIGDATKKALEKMAKAAETTESKTTPTPESQVKRRPQGTPTFQEAYAAAKAGIRFED